MRVLLVDDSNTMHKIQRNQLGGIGITDIIDAANGQEGMEKLAENMPVDIVLLDINMPIMDGMAMLRNVRQNPAYKDVKIIMVTSESEKSKVIEAVGAGANGYIVKPFTPEVFKEKLGL
ncbi:MAG: response regulator [Chitinivibrionales bacterium]|nr:response regulator [Chitinivibrionales bacterium]